MSDRREAARVAWSLMFELLEAERPLLLSIADEFELTPGQMHMLRHMEVGTSVSMSQMAVGRTCDRSTMTRLVDRLVSRGLVERREGEQDRRVKELRLTPEGEQLRERLMIRLREPPPSIASLSSEDLQALIRSFERAIAVARKTPIH